MSRVLTLVCRLVSLVICFALLGCQIFEPTTKERQHFPSDKEFVAPKSLQEEFPHLDFGSKWVADPEEQYMIQERKPMAKIGGTERYSFEFRNMTLAQGLHFIAQEANINIYLNPYLDQPIDASLPRVTFDEAVGVLLERNGLRLVEEPPGIFWVEQNDGTQFDSATFKVQSIRAVDVQDNLQELVQEDSTVVVNGAQNLILVRGPQADIQVVADYLRAADRLKRQVLIEVRILEVSLDERFELGVAAAINDQGVGAATANIMQAFTTTDDRFNLQLATGGGADATIQALSEYLGVNLVSSPRVLTVTDTEAIVEVIEEVPYVQVTSTTTSADSGIGSQVLQEVEFKEAGIKMTVTPTIQEGGVINIKVDNEISEVVSFFDGVPVVDSRRLASEFLVQDRDTIVMGGLMQNRSSKTDSGIPVLMDVPIFGRLFRSDEDTLEKRELMVFITPYILNPEQVKAMSGEFGRVHSERIKATGVVGEPYDTGEAQEE